eukprot:Clim_evm41s230 gene=Clim_evmTU41s230
MFTQFTRRIGTEPLPAGIRFFATTPLRAGGHHALRLGPRTAPCGKLGPYLDAGGSPSVTVTGWLEYRRRKGSMMFFTLRDMTGSVQVVMQANNDDPLRPMFDELRKVPLESIVAVSGTLQHRPTGQEKEPDLGGHDPEDAEDIMGKSQHVEVTGVSDVQIINTAVFKPFDVEKGNTFEVHESLGLQHRYLQLRSPKRLHILRQRSRFNQAMRDLLLEKDFLEVETPTLVRQNAEGARQYIVPSRHEAGMFFGLSQSPQQHKQLLMASGVDRYFQFARCYRDEDHRADRQPEFSQLDMEVAYAGTEEMMNFTEALVRAAVILGLRHELDEGPFPRMSWDDASRFYCSDKPDVRLSRMIHSDVSETEVHKRFTVDGCLHDAAMSNETFRDHVMNEVTEQARKHGMELKLVSGGDGGELTFEATGPKLITEEELGKIRMRMVEASEELGLAQGPRKRPADKFEFLWVENFPYLEMVNTPAGERRLAAVHHPFTAPPANVSVDEMVAMDEKSLLALRSQSYDLVLNGQEVGGGSVRIHDPEEQRRVFVEILGLDPDQFQHLLNALSSGCPPHAGLALGLDRLLATMLSVGIRDVIAFPKATYGKDPMLGCPSKLDEFLLTERHVKVTK